MIVLLELSESYDKKQSSQTLEDIPREMDPFYRRTLESMACITGGTKLTKAILVWTTCVVLPLTINELSGALTFDIRHRSLGLEENAVTNCGQLVMIDKLDKVQMIHGTSRESLPQEYLDSEFAINETEAHTRITRACLKYLNSEEIRSPRFDRHSPSATRSLELAFQLTPVLPFHFLDFKFVSGLEVLMVNTPIH